MLVLAIRQIAEVPDLLTADRVLVALADAGLKEISATAASKLAVYGNLLHKWNARTNLTSVRTVDGILSRHLVECVAAAQMLPCEIGSLLDFGAGAGLPGLPIQLVCESIRVTLVESQSKKAAFLREAVRVLELRCTVFGMRVEEMDAPEQFDCVTMRAVDKMPEAIPLAIARLSPGGWLAVLGPAGREILSADVRVGQCVRHPLPSRGELTLLQF